MAKLFELKDEYNQEVRDTQRAARLAAEDEYRRKATTGAASFRNKSVSLASGKLQSADKLQKLGVGVGVDLTRSGANFITKEEIDLLSSVMVNRIKDIGTRRAAPGRSQVLLSNRGL